MQRLLQWFALLLVALSAAMMFAHIGSSWLPTAVIAAAVIALFAAGRVKPRAAGRR